MKSPSPRLSPETTNSQIWRRKRGNRIYSWSKRSRKRCKTFWTNCNLVPSDQMDGHLSFDLCRKHDCSFSRRAFLVASTDPNSRTPCWETILKPLEHFKHSRRLSQSSQLFLIFSSPGGAFKVNEGLYISLSINCHLSVVCPFLVSNIVQLCLLSCKFLYESSSGQLKHTNTKEWTERNGTNTNKHKR